MPSPERIEPYFLNEDSLMAAFRRGDAESFRYIFDKTVRQLTYFVQNIVFSKTEAEDIVANSFSKLYKSREGMKSIDHVKRSLYVMARNESIDFLRHSRRHKDTKKEISYLSSEIADQLETERVKAVVLQAILSEIEQLPSQRRRVLKLYYFEHKTTAEISELLAINAQTVLNHKTKALESLRRKIPHLSEMLAFLTILFSISPIDMPLQ